MRLGLGLFLGSTAMSGGGGGAYVPSMNFADARNSNLIVLLEEF